MNRLRKQDSKGGKRIQALTEYLHQNIPPRALLYLKKALEKYIDYRVKMCDLFTCLSVKCYPMCCYR